VAENMTGMRDFSGDAGTGGAVMASGNFMGRVLKKGLREEIGRGGKEHGGSVQAGKGMSVI
jgi:hypothetical protein